MSKTLLIRIIIALVGIVYGSFIEGGASQKVTAGLFVSLLLFAIELLIEILQELRSRRLGRTEIELFAGKSIGLLGDLVRQLHAELDLVLRLDGRDIRVEHNSIAIHSYEEFWKLLLEEQGRRNGRSLEVKVIHSCGIEVWLSHPLTRPLLEHQRQFCRNGGMIRRILCGTTDVPDERLNRAAQMMREVGVEVYYYNLASNAITHHSFAWDFLVVEQTKHAAIWDSFANRPGGVIDVAVYNQDGEYKNKELRDLWNEVFQRSESFERVNPN